MNLSWESPTSTLLLNPRYSREEQERFQSILKESESHWPSHVWLATSGSHSPKWVGLSKQALLVSAEAVNQHLECHKKDVWVNTLPSFHVGGLGIWARAFLSGSMVYDYLQSHPGKWVAQQFYSYLQNVKGTLTSLVPAQLYDLITLKLRAPLTLRAILVGGGSLLPQLYREAILLGWPILPTYGLTECSSQVATACLRSWTQEKLPPLQFLSHVHGCEHDSVLSFSGPSLLTTYAYLEGKKVIFKDPKIKGWFTSDDRGIIKNREVTLLGRKDDLFKVGGENVNLASLEALLKTICIQLGITEKVALIAMPDARLGHAIHLASEKINQEKLVQLIASYQKNVLPFERIRKSYILDEFPLSPIGKIIKQQLIKRIEKKKD